MIRYSNWKMITIILVFFVCYGIVVNYSLYFKNIADLNELSFMKFGSSLNTAKGHFIGYLMMYVSLVYLNIQHNRSGQILLRTKRLRYTLSEFKNIAKITLYFVAIFIFVQLIQLLLICDFDWLISIRLYLMLVPLFLMLYAYYLISGIIFKLILDVTNLGFVAMAGSVMLNAILYVVGFMLLNIKTYIIDMTIVFNDFLTYYDSNLYFNQSFWIVIEYVAIAMILFIINIVIYKKKDVLE